MLSTFLFLLAIRRFLVGAFGQFGFGVNAFEEQSAERIELLRIDPAAERRQLERTARLRAERNAEEAAAAIAALREAARGDTNMLPPMREALRASCTVGEICESLREEWGMYDSQRRPS